MKTHPVTALIGGLIIGLLIGAIGARQLIFEHNKPIAEHNEAIHNDALQKYQAAVDELAIERRRASIYRCETEWARDQFKAYADSIEKFGWTESIDKKATVKAYRGHVKRLDDAIAEATR